MVSEEVTSCEGDVVKKSEDVKELKRRSSSVVNSSFSVVRMCGLIMPSLAGRPMPCLQYKCRQLL